MKHLTPEQHAQRMEIWTRMSAEGATWYAMAQAAGVHNTTFREWASLHAPGANAYIDKRHYHPKTVAGRIERGIERGQTVWRLARSARMTVDQLRDFCKMAGIALPEVKNRAPAPIPDAKFTEPKPSKSLPPAVTALRARIWHRGRQRGDSWRVMANEAGVTASAFQEWVARNIPESEHSRVPTTPRKPEKPPAKVIPCLCCREPMESEGPHHRMCSGCRPVSTSPFEPDWGRSNARRAAIHRA